MSKYLRWYSQEIPLQMQEVMNSFHEKFYISTLYNLYMEPIQTNGVGKVIVTFHADEKNEGIVEDLIDVVRVHKFIDLEKYKSLDEIGKKKYHLDLFNEALTSFFYQKGWDLGNWDKVYERIVDSKFVLKGYWGKSVSSPNRDHTAIPYFYFKDRLELYLEISENKKEGKSKILFAMVSPSIGSLKSSLKKVKWKDNNTVQVLYEGGKDYWSINVNGDVQFFYERAEKGDPHGQYDLGMMYLTGKSVLRNKSQALFWLKKSAEQNYTRAKNKILENF